MSTAERPPEFSDASTRVGASGTTARMRIIATTDLHMQLTGYDYVGDTEMPGRGLAGVATLIEAARKEAAAQGRACLLFDNGDLLQGNAMGRYLSRRPVTAAHPVVAGLNALHFDAIGLGNHDLDYGLDYLQDVARHLRMPVLASNFQGVEIGGVTGSALLTCALPVAPDEEPAHMTVGVLSVLPQATAIWNRKALGDAGGIEPATDCLHRAVPRLRAEGADIVIVLAHMGLGAPSGMLRDTACTLAEVPGIDALIAGHTHDRYPEQGNTPDAGAGGSRARLPMVMPGHAGSDLGVLDLTLKRAKGRWSVIGHVAGLRQNTPQIPRHQAILASTSAAHAAVRRDLAVSLGQTPRCLHNFFSLAAPTPTGALIARAEALCVTQAVEGRPEAALPVLVATSAHTAGGREGPGHFLSIPKGPVLRRHLAGLTPFSNEIWVQRVTGAELLRRLEHGARVFSRLDPVACSQPLRRADTPTFNFETVYGVHYAIDPTQPAGQRIRALQHDGHPVRPDQEFLLVTNQFRAAGGGGFESAQASRVVLQLEELDEVSFTRALGELETVGGPDAAPWQFAPGQAVRAALYTAPAARDCLSEISHLEPVDRGLTCDGFLHLNLTLPILHRNAARSI